ncbi:MAG: hypothetical protein RLZZ419_1335 [Pseudomonadota bacterium]|jgi:hypothetical protein
MLDCLAANPPSGSHVSCVDTYAQRERAFDVALSLNRSLSIKFSKNRLKLPVKKTH